MRHDAEDGSWSAAFGRPDPRLRSLVTRAYVGFEQRSGGPPSRLVPPSDAFTAVLNVAEPFAGLPSAFVAGVSGRGGRVEQAGTFACLDLKLTPLGAYTVFGVPMDELAGSVVALDDVVGVDGRRLAEAVAGRPTWEERFALVDEFMLRRAATGPLPSRQVVRAWRLVHASGGRVAIAALADEVGWSHRHLAARFRREVGLTPKRLARIVRVERALRLLWARPGRGAAEIALACGYADQAHFNRDVRDLVGTTPTELLADREVSFFQDAVPGPA